MNILMIGQGKGSFEVRGRQLGGALGARVVTVPSDDDVRWADVVVLIKRAGQAWATYVHGFKKPIVWDALDFWEQPQQNGLSEQESKALLHAMIKRIRPSLVIGATEAMAREAHGIYLPHHSREGLTPAPAREVVSVVGYEGHKKWLGKWGHAVQAECKRRGWQFVINPPDLRACDILVAFRDGQWDGWMCRQWKSGVKYVNAMSAGRPIITTANCAEAEIAPDGYRVSTESGLVDAFDFLESKGRRVEASEQSIGGLALPEVAATYRNILQGVVKAKAA